MATDVGLADGDTVDAARFNDRVPFIAGANKSKVKMCYARIRYTGSAWEVSSSADSAGIVSGNITWSTDHINIALSGYTATPCVAVTPHYVAAGRRIPMVNLVSASQIQVYFVDFADTIDTTQDTSMDCTLHIEGI